MNFNAESGQKISIFLCALISIAWRDLYRGSKVGRTLPVLALEVEDCRFGDTSALEF